MRVKIMTYNILYGMRDLKTKRFDSKRVNAIKKIVSKEKPDILCLTEANFGGANPSGIITDYEKIFAYKYSYFGSRTWEWGNVVLSQHPFWDSETHSDGRFFLIRTKIRIDGNTIGVDVMHPSPTVRDKEKINFMKRLFQNREANYVLTGDFNSLSDQDKYNKLNIRRKLGPLLSDKKSKEILNALTDMKLIPFLRKSGLKDIMEKFDNRFTIPTDLLDKKKESALRLDYFFTSKSVKVRNARVIKNKLTEVASDHYPIVMEIEL